MNKKTDNIESRQLEELKQQIFTTSLSKSEKIAILREEIALKQYKVSNQRIAVRMSEEFTFANAVEDALV